MISWIEKADIFFDKGIKILELNPDTDKNILIGRVYNMSAVTKMQLNKKKEGRGRIESGIKILDRKQILSKDDIIHLASLKTNQPNLNYLAILI